MEEPQAAVEFGPFRLDPGEGGGLWRGATAIPLQPRPLAVLRHLVARPGVVVSRQEMLDALWSGTVVTKAVLKVAVRSVREALGDDASAPRYVETVGRDGYRFIGLGAPVGAAADAGARSRAAGGVYVGRTAEHERLRALCDESAAGARRLVFLTGEAGIGKTTLLERFLGAIADRPGVAVGRGQCLEQYGEGEPYLPILEAVGRLLRAGDAPMAAALRRHAPTWAAQLPGLGGDDPPARPAGATSSQRMLREMADALDVITRDRTLVLALEDLHWSDRSTLELLSYLASRRDPARLLVVGTFRPTDVIVRDHPLHAIRRELRAKGLCEELPLELLSEAEVGAYLARRFPGASALTVELVRAMHARTEGNALFVVNVVGHLLGQGLIAHVDEAWRLTGTIEDALREVPDGLLLLIEKQLTRLTPARQRVLEIGALVGADFTVATVAAALEADPDAVEECCEEIAAQGQLLAESGLAEWPDGTLSGRYRFRHALYQQVLAARIAAPRRIRLHGVIAAREERGHGERVHEIAAELAMHFARAREDVRAMHYLEIAAANALRRAAPHEAVGHLTQALALSAAVLESAEGRRRELRLQVALGTALQAAQGYAAPAVARAYARARELCHTAEATPAVFPVLRGLISYHHVRAELHTARGLGDELLAHAATTDDPVLRAQAHYAQGATLFHLADFSAAARHFEEAIARYDPTQHEMHATRFGGYDPGVASHLWLGMTRWILGRPDGAESIRAAGVALAERLGDPFSLAWAVYASGVVHGFRGEWTQARAGAERALAIADEHDFEFVRAIASMHLGWAEVVAGAPGGAARIEDGLRRHEATGAALVRPSYLAMLAACEVGAGNLEGAAARLEEAFAAMERTDERVYEVDLLCARARLILARAAGETRRRRATDEREAEALIARALAVARGQGARAYELQAAAALARLWERQGRAAEIRPLLAPIVASFDEGRESRDVRAAVALLEVVP